MNIRKLISDFAAAFMAQGLAVAISLVTSLVVPKFLGVEQYGYWQLFILYATYVSFFHLGLDDGVYLINGGTPRGDLDRRSIMSQYWVSMAYQLVFALVIILVAVFGGFGPEREFVIICMAVFILVQNTATFFGYILQAVNETNLYSYSMMVERVTFAIPTVALLLMRIPTFQPYVLAFVFSSVCQTGYCLWHTRDLLSARMLPVSEALGLSAESIRVGIKLMLATTASTLILGVARFVTDAVWGITTFGELSLSLSMVSFFLQFVSQASMVLFPALRQGDKGLVSSFYVAARDAMSLLFPLIYLLYFPMVWILGMWLPQYANSFVFFAYLIPICVFDSKMNITGTTMFKVRRMESTLLRVNMITVCISAAGTFVGAYLFDSVHVVIASVVAAIVFRSIFSESIINDSLHVPASRLYISEIVITLVFIGATVALPAWAAALIYALAYATFVYMHRDVARRLLKQLASLARGTGKDDQTANGAAS